MCNYCRTTGAKLLELTGPVQVAVVMQLDLSGPGKPHYGLILALY